MVSAILAQRLQRLFPLQQRADSAISAILESHQLLR
jgi:hypothetical protein